MESRLRSPLHTLSCVLTVLPSSVVCKVKSISGTGFLSLTARSIGSSMAKVAYKITDDLDQLSSPACRSLMERESLWRVKKWQQSRKWESGGFLKRTWTTSKCYAHPQELWSSRTLPRSGGFRYSPPNSLCDLAWTVSCAAPLVDIIALRH